MSTSAQPLGTRPPVLNHRDIILNRSLSQLSPQENHLEYHLKPDSTEPTGVQRCNVPTLGHHYIAEVYDDQSSQMDVIAST